MVAKFYASLTIHGEHLVYWSCALLAASQEGLTETELVDLLSCCDDVMDELQVCVKLFVRLYVCPSVRQPGCRSVDLAICTSVCVRVCRSVCWSVRLRVCASMCMCVCLCVRLSVDLCGILSFYIDQFVYVRVCVLAERASICSCMFLYKCVSLCLLSV